MPDTIALAKKITDRFEENKQQRRFEQIAKLITLSLDNLPQAYNLQIFGYIPAIFRQVEIRDYHLELVISVEESLLFIKFILLKTISFMV